MRLRISCLLLALLCCATLAHAQDSPGPGPKKARTPDDYKLRTLKEIATLGLTLVRAAEHGRSPASGEVHTLVHGDLLPSRVKFTYKGLTRTITRNRKAVISEWAQRYAGAPQHYTGAYTREALFTEMGVAHWLVVRSDDLPGLRKNLRRGRAVDLYLIRLGAFKIRDTWQWVLLVEDFAKPE